MSLDSTFRIRTPEGIVFAQPLAGPISRFLAWGVDLLCILGLTVGLSVVVGLLGLIAAGLAQAAWLVLFFAVWIGYGMVLEWVWRGQTVGKRLLRLRVVDAHGLKLQPSQIVLRNLLRAVDMLPGLYLVGGLTCLLSRRAQRLGDLAANTVVVRIPEPAEPNLQGVLAGKYNSLRAYPHLVARLRQRVTAHEAALALQALLRREQLDPESRLELFGQLAAHFKAKVAFPAEALEGLTDEQYVRNLVEVLYRTSGASQAQPRPAASS